MRRIASKLTYANVMSTIAVFVALGGGAFAASRSRFVGPTGIVKLCVGGSGNVKAIAAQKGKCAKGASLVAVNQRGPKGAPGPQGPAGPGGSASSYTAGSGLTLSGNSFSADLTKLQARLAGSGCAADQALQSVAANGTPSCTGLHAYSAVAASAALFQNATSTVIPAGTWLLIARAQATTAASGDTITCKLQINNHTVDTTVQSIAASGQYATVTPIATVTTTGTASVAQILCDAGSAQTTIGGNLTIAAIPLAALN
jgi:hypothetical protein